MLSCVRLCVCVPSRPRPSLPRPLPPCRPSPREPTNPRWPLLGCHHQVSCCEETLVPTANQKPPFSRSQCVCVLVVVGEEGSGGEGRLHPASNHSASACLSHSERRLHLEPRHFEGADAERRRPGLPQRFLFSSLACSSSSSH